ncbi:hypothetical protein C8J56DRAFT_1160071, partial [Mycena floridula]
FVPWFAPSARGWLSYPRESYERLGLQSWTCAERRRDQLQGVRKRTILLVSIRFCAVCHLLWTSTTDGFSRRCQGYPSHIPLRPLIY